MTKQELIDRIANATGETKKTVGLVLDQLNETIADTLKLGGEVELRGVGKFSVSKRAAKTGRNPKTGEKLTIPAHLSPAFKASKALKAVVNA